MRRKNISFDFLKKQVKILTLFVTFCFSTYSLEFLSSNGENYFYYNNSKSTVEKVNLDLEKNSIEIDYMKFGFFIDGKQYEIGEKDYKLEKLEESNILKLTGEFDGVTYVIDMFSSVLQKSNIIFNVKLGNVDNKKDIQFYTYIKPRSMGKLTKNDKNYKYNNFNFGTRNKLEKVYLTDDTKAKEKKLKIFAEDSLVKANEGIFLISTVDLQKPEIEIWFSKNKEYVESLNSEKEYWNKLLGKEKQKKLYSILLMFKRNKLLVDISGETPLISMEEVLKYLELTLMNKNYSEAKSILEYLIFETDNIEGIIPSDYLSLNGKEVYKKDNYGIYNSYYRKSVFLKLYLKYLTDSKDEEFYAESFEKVKVKLIDLLESKVSEMGMEKDSGNGRIGADGYERFIETQYETYKAFEILDEFYRSKNIKEDKYGRISEDLKELIILYYIDNINVADYPFSKSVNPKNIFYVNEELFFSENDYYYALQKNIELLKNENSSLNEKVTFVNYLYDKKYYLMAQAMSKDIENNLEGDKGIEILQKDLSLLINYLIMKEKGEVNGVNE